MNASVARREYGKLTIVKRVSHRGRMYYRCRCSCPEQETRDVLPSSLWNGLVVACVSCTTGVAREVAPSHSVSMLRRVSVTIDPDVMQSLGLTAAVSGAEVRQWLRIEAKRRG